MKRSVARLLASGLGSGYVPVAPGTFGSLAAMALGVAMLHLAPAALPFAVIGVTLLGLWSVRAAGVEEDPGWVVIDEFAGMWIAMLPIVTSSIAPGPLPLTLAFVTFRALDVLKPGPVGWADRQGGAAGVMADDVIAGAMAAAVLWLASLAMPEWCMAGWDLATWVGPLGRGNG
jgi:phosphatidylglycerophosphatase A